MIKCKYKHRKGNTMHDHAIAAKRIKEELKRLGIKSTVSSKSYSGGNSVRVEVNNLHPKDFETIKTMFAKYEYGHFDGMDDSYKFSNVIKDFPQTKYLFINNHWSDEICQKAYDEIRTHYVGFENAPEKYDDAFNFVWENGRCYAQQFVYRQLYGDAEFCEKIGIKPILTQVTVWYDGGKSADVFNQNIKEA